jgi:hypothetical protein
VFPALLLVSGCAKLFDLPPDPPTAVELYRSLYEQTEEDLYQCEDSLTDCQNAGGSLLPHIE